LYACIYTYLRIHVYICYTGLGIAHSNVILNSQLDACISVTRICLLGSPSSRTHTISGSLARSLIPSYFSFLSCLPSVRTRAHVRALSFFSPLSHSSPLSLSFSHSLSLSLLPPPLSLSLARSRLRHTHTMHTCTKHTYLHRYVLAAKRPRVTFRRLITQEDLDRFFLLNQLLNWPILSSIHGGCVASWKANLAKCICFLFDTTHGSYRVENRWVHSIQKGCSTLQQAPNTEI